MEERKDNFYGDDDAFYIEVNDSEDGTYSSLEGGYSSFGELEEGSGEPENANSNSESNENQKSIKNVNDANANANAKDKGNDKINPSKPSAPKKPVIKVVPRRSAPVKPVVKSNFDWGAFLMGLGAGFVLKLVWDALRRGKKHG